MANTTIYTCDICKQSKSKEDLAKIKVSSEGIRMKNVGYNEIKIDICSDCLQKKGFIVEAKQTKEEQEVAEIKNKKTLEDKLLDILEDIGVAFAE